MKLKELWMQLSAADAKQHNRDQERFAVSRVLKKLKSKEQRLQQMLAVETDSEEREQLQLQLNILHLQREKGLHLLKEDGA